MTAYYNEYDAKAAAWLRELIKVGLIAPGVVDERSIIDVKADELRGFTQCHFFAGIGGWSYALRLAGWSDDRPVWTGSCPCQPYSTAGKGQGFADERHLWPAWFWLIKQCRPDVIFGEQVEAAINHGWLDLVCSDLEREDYRIGAVGLPACGVGAPHIRQRLWFVADANGERSQGRARVSECANQCAVGPSGLADWVDVAEASERRGFGNREKHSSPAQTGRSGKPSGLAESDSARREQGQRHNQTAGHGDTIAAEGCDDRSKPADTPEAFWANPDWLFCRDGKWRPVESGTFPLAHGIPERVGLLRGYGNAIVPQVAAEVIRAYIGGCDD